MGMNEGRRLMSSSWIARAGLLLSFFLFRAGTLTAATPSDDIKSKVPAHKRPGFKIPHGEEEAFRDPPAPDKAAAGQTPKPAPGRGAVPPHKRPGFQIPDGEEGAFNEPDEPPVKPEERRAVDGLRDSGDATLMKDLSTPEAQAAMKRVLPISQTGHQSPNAAEPEPARLDDATLMKDLSTPAAKAAMERLKQSRRPSPPLPQPADEPERTPPGLPAPKAAPAPDTERTPAPSGEANEAESAPV